MKNIVIFLYLIAFCINAESQGFTTIKIFRSRQSLSTQNFKVYIKNKFVGKLNDNTLITCKLKTEGKQEIKLQGFNSSTRDETTDCQQNIFSTNGDIYYFQLQFEDYIWSLKEVGGEEDYINFNSPDIIEYSDLPNNQSENIVFNDNKVNNSNVIANSDVDLNIPDVSATNDKSFAVIIGNETYTKEIKVKYALNDARVFKQYTEKTLGLPSNNIHYIENATYGQMLDALKWINDVAKAYDGTAKIIFYYAGHGMPDEQTKSSFILPIDGNSQNTQTAVKLSNVYDKLTEFPSISVTVFLDACFSGSARETDGSMLAEGRGVRIKPKSDLIKGNMVVFSAATGDETAYPYSEKQHGMFTYFLLKKLQESKGNSTLSELSNYISTNVMQQSIVVNKKSQTPQVNTSTQIQNTWRLNKLK